MNLKDSVRNYVKSMIEDNTDSMKVLILDDETLRIVNSVYSMSEIMKHGVYLCEKINSKRESLNYLDCVCFLRPTLDNIRYLEVELHSPHYKSYNLHFSQSISKQNLKILAEADQNELVTNVQESFADFQPLEPFLFQLSIKNAIKNKEWELATLGRTTEGIISLLLALKICPQIRYQNSSEAARRLSEQLKTYISREASLFDFKQNKVPLLLIIDRRLDPVTPLLNQWTYQAMINELLPVKNDCVTISTDGENKEINLNADHDEFYRQNLYKNFGEICSNIKVMMDEIQVKSRCQSKLDTIEDMKKFIETYPSFKKLSTKVSQHVLLISEISRIISSNKLLELSECEQNIVSCQVIDNHTSCIQMIKTLLADSKLKKHDALKLVLLYALKFDKNSRRETSNLMSLLSKQAGVNDKEIQLIRILTDFSSIKSPDLFKEKTNSFGIPANFLKSIKGVENIYTQHQPFISTLIDNVAQSKLKESSYPFVSNCVNYNQRVTDLIVFVVGGITCEEALAVHNTNQAIQGLNIVLGGTNLLNSRTFLEEVVHWSGEHTLEDTPANL